MRPGRFEIAVRFHLLVSLIIQFFPFKAFYRLLLISRGFYAVGFKKSMFFPYFCAIIAFRGLVAVFYIIRFQKTETYRAPAATNIKRRETFVGR
jgi:hypothetical protein